MQDTKHDRKYQIEYDPYDLQKSITIASYVKRAEPTQNVFLGHCVEVATSTNIGRTIGHKNLGS